MAEEKQPAKKYELSKTAYGGEPGDEYVPYIPTTVAMPELTGYLPLLERISPLGSTCSRLLQTAI
jgi:hypothetical protein